MHQLTTLVLALTLATGCAANVAPSTAATDSTKADNCGVPASVTAYAAQLAIDAPDTQYTFFLAQADGTRWEVAPGGYLLHTTDAGSDVGELLCVRGQGDRIIFERSAQ